MPTRYDIDIYKGNSFELTVSATEDDGSAFNLSGYALSGNVRLNLSSSDSLVTLSPQATSSVSGIIDLFIPRTGTTGLPVTKAFYDVLAVSGLYAYTIVQGYADIHPEITM